MDELSIPFFSTNVSSYIAISPIRGDGGAGKAKSIYYIFIRNRNIIFSMDTEKVTFIFVFSALTFFVFHHRDTVNLSIPTSCIVEHFYKIARWEKSCSRY